MTVAALKVAGRLSAELIRPEAASALLVFAHGAGADFRHANMVAIAHALAEREVATLRFNFPFMEAGRRRVDAPRVSIETIEAAVATAVEAAPELKLFLGGHSYGGRMSSHAALRGVQGLEGLVFCAFPLHPPRKPGIDRAAHLDTLEVPMLFLSGTRDALAERDLLERVVARLEPRARVHWLDTADHGYKVLKRSRRVALPVFDEMAVAIAAFVAEQS